MLCSLCKHRILCNAIATEEFKLNRTNSDDCEFFDATLPFEIGQDCWVVYFWHIRPPQLLKGRITRITQRIDNSISFSVVVPFVSMETLDFRDDEIGKKYFNNQEQANEIYEKELERWRIEHGK